jgi:SH3 domain-containing protein
MNGSGDRGFKGISRLVSELDIPALKSAMSTAGEKAKRQDDKQLADSPGASPREGQASRASGSNTSARNSDPTKPDFGGIGVAVFCVAVLMLIIYANVKNEDGAASYNKAPPQFNQSYHVTAGTLNVRASPTTSSPVIAKLTNGQNVYASSKSSTQAQGWRQIEFGGESGWVSTAYLERGTAEEARIAQCKAEATRPPTGEILNKNGSGPHTLVVNNGPNGDVIAKLKDRRGNEIISFYVRAGETARVNGIPEGFFKFQFATGRYYSPSCGGRFMEGMRVSEDPKYAHYETTNNGYARYTSIMEYTLTQVRSGNLHMKSVSPEKF